MGDNKAMNQHKSMAMGDGVQGKTPGGKGPSNEYKKGGVVKASPYKKGGMPRKSSGKNC